LVWTRNFLQDYADWKNFNPHIRDRIDRLIEAVAAHPKPAIGKPEKLRYLKNTFALRITQEHRLIYRLCRKDATIELLSCYGHYDGR
jgi:Txe/YoeB family toxin of toxin-antitoxin system